MTYTLPMLPGEVTEEKVPVLGIVHHGGPQCTIHRTFELSFSLTDLTEDLWDRSYEVDLKAHFLTGETVMPRMIEQKRRVYDYFF